MFRRRDPRSYSRIAREALWPRGGWTRAITYMRHRVQRLPDPPHKIARGVGVGVFSAFTPFYGLHFFLAWGLARAVGGNGIAALIGTFFGNPLTYLPIAWVSLATGHWMLGNGRAMAAMDKEEARGVFSAFAQAGEDLWHNLLAAFGPARARWGGLEAFWDEVFLPWLVGGIVPGIVCGIAAYYLCLPAIAAYQKARQGKIAKRLAALKAKAVAAREARREAKPAKGAAPKTD